VLSHDKVWAAIDALASQNGLSPSGLARLAGLDPTTFNPSKRVAGDGRPRWPSTESLAKILAVTGDAFLPLYRDGAIVVVSPSAPTGSEDRLLIQPRQGDPGLFEFLEDTATSIKVRAVGNKTQTIHIRYSAIAWSARIIWASQ